MLQNKHISIPKKVANENQQDFSFLKKTGIKYIEQLAGKLWTDYNSHDPGITTLEVLSYAITDLGMRMNLNMEDLLGSDEKDRELHNQFIKASDILPSKAVTELDFRKIFIDTTITRQKNGKPVLIRPIKNCWLTPAKEVIHVDCKTGKMAYKKEALNSDKTRPFDLKGQYVLLVELDTGLKLSDCEKSDAKAEILKRFHAQRNLCEDLVEIKEVDPEKIEICADIELRRQADEEMVHAKVLDAIEQYLAPTVPFYTLEQMLNKGVPSDVIFEGPLLSGGFIESEELKNSQLRKEIRRSDLINVIMKIDGVKQIKGIQISKSGTPAPSDSDWVLCVTPGKKPVLDDKSAFGYAKGALPLNINQKQVEAYRAVFRKDRTLAEMSPEILESYKKDNQITLPKGSSNDLSVYSSILNDLPETYGVGENGIMGESTPEREALAKQLKGYLLFFDTILASYFKHLDKVKDLLSINGRLTRTYFTQALKGINGFDDIVKNYEKSDDVKLTDQLFKEIDNNVQRRNQILDHLIGRFAEQFNEYTFLMKSLYGASTDEIVLDNKEQFLAEYKEISAARGDGFNYYRQPLTEIWNTNNVAGVQKRIARLLGIKNYKRRTLSASPVVITKTGDKYSWTIKDDAGNILLSSVNLLNTELEALKQVDKVVFQAIQIDKEDLENKLKNTLKGGDKIAGIQVQEETVSGVKKYRLVIINDDTDGTPIGDQKFKEGNVDKDITYGQDQLEPAIKNIVDYFKNKFTEEGIFLVEHLLLKPTNEKNLGVLGIGCMKVDSTFVVATNKKTGATTSDEFMSTCDEGCESELFDPYTYRVTVVLPGYGYRFADPNYRKYAEQLIREELPAHILAKICWVGSRQNDVATAQSDLKSFETAFQKFLTDKTKEDTASLVASTKSLILAMNNLNNIYRPGRLLDCTSENTNLDGRIILGQSNL